MSEATQVYLDSLTGPTEDDLKREEKLENLLNFSDADLADMDAYLMYLDDYDDSEFFGDDEYPYDKE